MIENFYIMLIISCMAGLAVGIFISRVVRKSQQDSQ